MAIQVRQLSSAKCRTAASTVHADPGTEAAASLGLSRKVAFSSSTEACWFVWIFVKESLCFLQVEARPSVAWGHHLSSATPGLIDRQ